MVYRENSQNNEVQDFDETRCKLPWREPENEYGSSKNSTFSGKLQSQLGKRSFATISYLAPYKELYLIMGQGTLSVKSSEQNYHLHATKYIRKSTQFCKTHTVFLLRRSKNAVLLAMRMKSKLNHFQGKTYVKAVSLLAS